MRSSRVLMPRRIRLASGGESTICQFGLAIENSAPIVRHLILRRALRQFCATAMDEWRDFAAD